MREGSYPFKERREGRIRDVGRGYKRDRIGQNHLSQDFKGVIRTKKKEYIQHLKIYLYKSFITTTKLLQEKSYTIVTSQRV